MTTPTTAGRELYPRLVRRETHSSRSGSAIVLAVLLILLFAWLGTEAVLAVLAQPALLVAPQDGASSLLSAAAAPIAVTAAAGAVLALIGLVLIVVSLKPGRRGRRAVGTDRTAAVVDDRVIAQAVARTAGYAGDVDPDSVSVSVGSRVVEVTVNRASGRSVELAPIREAVDAELATYDCTPRLRSKVRVSEKGTVR